MYLLNGTGYTVKMNSCNKSLKRIQKGYKKDISLKYTVFRILDIDELHRVARRCEVYRMQSCHGEEI